MIPSLKNLFTVIGPDQTCSRWWWYLVDSSTSMSRLIKNSLWGTWPSPLCPVLRRCVMEWIFYSGKCCIVLLVGHTTLVFRSWYSVTNDWRSRGAGAGTLQVEARQSVLVMPVLAAVRCKKPSRRSIGSWSSVIGFPGPVAATCSSLSISALWRQCWEIADSWATVCHCQATVVAQSVWETRKNINWMWCLPRGVQRLSRATRIFDEFKPRDEHWIALPPCGNVMRFLCGRLSE